MKKRVEIYMIIIVWTIAIAALIFSFVQMKGYATIINDAGIVRGGTQRIVKLELEHAPNVALINRVDRLLSTLQKNEDELWIKNANTLAFMQDLKDVREKWNAIKAAIIRVRVGEDGEDLLSLSEEHFKLADVAVYSAQLRAERALQICTTITVILFLFAAVFMAMFEIRSNKRSKHIFYTDPITNRDNNAAFLEKARGILKGAFGGQYLLVYSNVNNFKFINQAYGHVTGDRLIRLLSEALVKSCKAGELCAHTAADHFLLLLRNEEDATKRISAAFELALESDSEINLSEIISCSFGVYEITGAAESVQAMISKASLALSQGRKRQGIAFYDSELLEKLARENLLTKHMHEGIERGEYQVYLQAKANLATGEIIGVEVLCRWISAKLGFLPPDEFIPLFEKNGFIVNLDFYMLEQACKEFSEVYRERPEKVLAFSINFSRVSLLQDDFVERFITIVEKYGLQRGDVQIEVTESAFTMEEDTVIRMLEDLRSRGVPIAMDDFGLGYSSLNLLRKLPIDVLKIDKEFLREGARSERIHHIIACIVQMSQKLDIKVVCEGVETLEQVELLKQIGCDIGQGYYYSKPISVPEFVKKYVTVAVEEI